MGVPVRVPPSVDRGNEGRCAAVNDHWSARVGRCAVDRLSAVADVADGRLRDPLERRRCIGQAARVRHRWCITGRRRVISARPRRGSLRGEQTTKHRAGERRLFAIAPGVGRTRHAHGTERQTQGQAKGYEEAAREAGGWVHEGLGDQNGGVRLVQNAPMGRGVYRARGRRRAQR